MGRQIQLHVLPEDVQRFLGFVQEHDPVIVTLRDSDSSMVSTVAEPSSETQVMTLWNQAILSSLQRKHVVYPGQEYFRIDASLPTLEFSPSSVCDWNGRPALLQGRLYGFFDKPFKEYEKWYGALARWIRKNFIKNPVPRLESYVGQAAYDWFKKGGLLLPMFQPPLTSQWLSWMEAQDQRRAVFSK